MNDKQLADRILAVDDRFYMSEPEFAYFMYVDDRRSLAQGVGDYPGQFVRDPRVAMALMEKCKPADIVVDTFLTRAKVQIGDHPVATNESLPRAICEACCEALENEN